MDNRELEWIESIRQGDALVFEAMVCAHGPELRRVASGLLRNREDTQDVVQDVLLRVWQGRGKWRPTASIRAYLYTATRNRSLNLLERRRVRSAYRAEMQYDGTHESELQASRSPAEALAAAEEQVAQMAGLRRTYARLSERQQLAVRLRYEKGLTFPEMAVGLGVSESAAEQLVARAIRAMRAGMRDGLD
jgi:RNA polymerase sigma-70 factor (ECF subfamily)